MLSAHDTSLEIEWYEYILGIVCHLKLVIQLVKKIISKQSREHCVFHIQFVISRYISRLHIASFCATIDYIY